MSMDNGIQQVYEFTEGTLNQAAPVQNTYYYLIGSSTAGVANVIVYLVSVNVEDTNETLEAEIVLDGVTLAPDDRAVSHSTDYFLEIYPSAINRAGYVRLSTDLVTHYRGFLCAGKDVRVRVRKTTNAGVGNLTGYAAYGVLA